MTCQPGVCRYPDMFHLPQVTNQELETQHLSVLIKLQGFTDIVWDDLKCDHMRSSPATDIPHLR